MNATEYQERKSDAILAAIGSALLHLVIFLLCLWISYLGVQMVQEKDAVEKKSDVIVLLRPENFEREELGTNSNSIAPPKEKKRKFSDSNPAIAETIPTEQTKLIGERNTIAASETALDEGDPNIPTQLTREQPRKETPVMYDSRFNDEKTQQISLETEQEETIAQSNLSNDQVSENAKKENSEIITDKTNFSSVAQARQDIFENQRIIESPKKLTEDRLNQIEDSNIATTTEVDGLMEETKSLKKMQAASEASESGFSSEKTKTRMIGSLSRDGKSALNVKSTALGKYYAGVGKIIEQEWQRKCVQYRNLVHPGVISLQFSIDKNGKTSNIRQLDTFHTSSAQLGFTIKSISRSKFPQMSAEAQKELGERESEELIFNFTFD